MEPDYVLFDFDGWVQWMIIRNRWYVDPQYEQEFIANGPLLKPL